MTVARSGQGDAAKGARVIALRDRVVGEFKDGDWQAIGLLTGQSEVIDRHPRLLRSLRFGDEDYEGNVLTVLRQMSERDGGTLAQIEQYLNEHYPGESEYISSKPAVRRLEFAPNVFQVPEGGVEGDLVAVMMPLAKEFDPVLVSIKAACADAGFRCLRADDIWEDSVIIQDIFNLIFKAHAIVVDFTGKNPNVMYETGIAHTLGKHVVPISQVAVDVPFDLAHHRYLKYLANAEGLAGLQSKLAAKLKLVGVGGQDVPY